MHNINEPNNQDAGIDPYPVGIDPFLQVMAESAPAAIMQLGLAARSDNYYVRIQDCGAFQEPDEK